MNSMKRVMVAPSPLVLSLAYGSGALHKIGGALGCIELLLLLSSVLYPSSPESEHATNSNVINSNLIFFIH